MKWSSKNLTYEARRRRIGYIFVAPWIIGFLFFFAKPLIQSLFFTFQDLEISRTGFDYSWTKLANYNKAFFQDPLFLRYFGNEITSLLYNVPIVVLFSLFVASLLNQPFKGRTLARAVFFLPAIISSGVVISVIREDVLAGSIGIFGEFVSEVYLFETGAFQRMLLQSGLNTGLVEIINNIVARTFELTWKSGIQILLFLAGLQSIPRSLYEAANADGATGWDKFWKITLPMISPVIVVNVVYTVVDTFADYGNSLMRHIYSVAFEQGQFTYSATLAWIFFVVIIVLLGFVMFLLGRRTFYISE